MGLNNLLNVLSAEALAAVRPSVVAAMKATVTIFDPDISGAGYTATTGATTVSPDDAIYTGVARIIPLQNTNITDGDSIQRVTIQTIISEYSAAPQKGMIVKVTAAPLNLKLLSYVYTVIGLMDSSNPITQNLECSVNYAYVSD